MLLSIAVLLSMIIGAICGELFGWAGLLISVPVAILLGYVSGDIDSRK